MWSKIKPELKIMWVLFMVFFIIFGVLFSVQVLLIVPLVKWSKFGVLHFPVDWPELRKLFGFVFFASAAGAFLMWLVNKFTKHK